MTSTEAMLIKFIAKENTDVSPTGLEPLTLLVKSSYNPKTGFSQELALG